MEKIHCYLLALLSLVLTVGVAPVRLNSQEKVSSNNEGRNETSSVKGMPNIPFATMGGKQFWTDHRWVAGWRIQQNAVTGHWRLLDGRNIRRAWGSLAACQEALGRENLQVLPPDTETAYLLLHGLGRSASSMQPIEEALTGGVAGSEHAAVIQFEYASSRASVQEHAQALVDVVDGLPGDVRLRFVGHSLGNIVLRYAIKQWQEQQRQDVLDRIERVVMLGPPNQGSSIAKRLAKIGVFKLLTGESGQELGQGWNSFQERLATPECPFGIIAGRLESKLGQNPLVDGEGDFVVSVEETKLAGAADFLEIPQLHTFLMDDPTVQAAVLRFMENAKFTR